MPWKKYRAIFPNHDFYKQNKGDYKLEIGLLHLL